MKKRINGYIYKKQLKIRYSLVKLLGLATVLALFIGTTMITTPDINVTTVTKTTVIMEDIDVDASKLLAGGTLKVAEIIKDANEKATIKVEQFEVKTRTSAPVELPKIETITKYYTEQDVIEVAKLLTKEGGGIPSDTEQSGVPWIVLNRVKSPSFPNTIHGVITQSNQFEGWHEETVPYDHCIEIARDVLERWNREMNGEINVGRTLPEEYLYFTGDGVHNYFTIVQFGTPYVWGSKLPSPYET
ncbi:cell wall hydrolase [Candidatus Saccharibacteria bacterium]|nr:cell wall hydrolase [Candidatus Saccharibacteria bacterium]